MFTHVVLFKIKDAPTNAPRVRDGLLALKNQIPQLKHIEVGLDVLHTARSYDVALFTRFESRADHDAYQVHPAHKAFVEFILPLRDSSVVVDYED